MHLKCQQPSNIDEQNKVHSNWFVLLQLFKDFNKILTVQKYPIKTSLE